MSGWSKELFADRHARVVDEREVERRRRQRVHQERAVVARIYPRGDIVAFPTRPPTPPDRAA